jgi:hypothetical protein
MAQAPIAAPPTPAQGTPPAATPPPATTPPPAGAQPAPAPSPAGTGQPAAAIPPAGDIRQALKIPQFWKNLTGDIGDDPEPGGKPAGAPAAAAQAAAAGAPSTPPLPDPGATPATPSGQESPATPPATPAPGGKKKKKQPSADETTARTAAIAAEAAAKAVSDSMASRILTAPAAAQPSAPTPQQLVAQLPEEFRDNGDVYFEMGRMNPEKYGNLIPKIIERARKEDEYRMQWKGKNPNGEFDPDDPEHDDFYESISIGYSDRDFKTAERSIIKQEAKREVLSEIEPRLKEHDSWKKTQEVQPEISRAVGGVFSALLPVVNPEYATKPPTPDELAKLAETDPVGAEALALSMQRWRPVVEETVRLYNGATPFDVKNPAHVAVADMLGYLEREIPKLALEDRLDEDGRRFATREEYMNLSPQQRADRWTVSKDNLLVAISSRAAAEAERFKTEEQEKLDRYLRAKGYTPKAGGNGAPARAAAAAQPTTPAPTTPPTSGSPSVPGSATMRTDNNPPSSQPANWRDNFGMGARGV